MMPSATMSQYSSVCALKPKLPVFSSTLANNDRAFNTGIYGDLTDRGFESLRYDLDAGHDVRVVVYELFNGLLGTQQSHATTGNDAFFDSSPGSVQRIVNAILAFFHFNSRSHRQP